MIDYDTIFTKKRIDFKLILVVIVAVVLSAYLIDLMFGKHSFSRMLDLDNNLKVLNKKVVDLKKENQHLQKEYFELKELEGN